ncbi:MAG TPA: BON domain-containing protein [Terriglobales bacterium]|nr:BON domain-containing protein [Terriglobales bacterium]
MRSPVSPALAKLDDSLAIVLSQLECLHAALQVDEDQLGHNLTEACYRASMLRDLIRGERPGADWSDRRALDQLVQEFEAAAKAKRNEERRHRLREVANELEAGRVKHRIDARTTALNALRLEAVQSLRTEALAEEVKDLPGPKAEEWLHWVCRLEDGTDATALANLRRDFPLLERFAAAIEERYWIPGPKLGELAAGPFELGPATVPAVRPGTSGFPRPNAPVSSVSNSLPENVRAQFDKAMQSGNYVEALALCYGRPSSDASPVSEPLWDSEAETFWGDSIPSARSTAAAPAAPSVNFCESCGSTYRGEFHLCPVNHSTLRATSEAILGTATRGGYLTSPGDVALQPAEAPGVDPTPESAETEFERLKGILEQSGTPEAPLIFDEPAPLNRQLIAWIVGASVVVLCVILAIAYHFNKAATKPAVVVASTNDAGTIQDSEIQKQVEQRLADLKDGSIQVSVQGGVVTLEGQLRSQAEVVEAETLAAQASGVNVVESKLQVQAHRTGRAAPVQRRSLN